ncbi:pilus assembly protein PilL [Gallibacterium salpingitidis]|uniref:PFGI-1 class ICE element type IV pilus protein PilL2 n=1 Tax=Gallibacterium salpingitidis TaxID=505341 RepID=UPI000804C29A|nr:pilus assembly protein PilL [Gallibacterium salpingitidis]OBX06775.1 pilus assembly protein PilL [Gallibacterium salpingitidis]WKS98608.1 pilus assembly protein PilL [Gallibacterium salpingitidis]
MKKTLLTTLVASLIILTGCSHSKNVSSQQEASSVPTPVVQEKPRLINEVKVVSPDIYVDEQEQPRVIETDRYQLTNIDTQITQKYLLDQFVIVKMQPKKNQKFLLEQGLRFTLEDTGLALCSSLGQPHLSTLYSRPLPKIHQKFGPMRLRDALQMLAGPAYQLTINEQTRTVCFQLREMPKPTVLTEDEQLQQVAHTAL